LRPFQIAAASASERDTLTVFGRNRSAIATMRDSASSISSSEPSTSTISMASTSSG
jgi:hypothetical protein